MNAQPSISVIIPTFNTGPFVADAIESVLGQTVGVHEIIVVDDGSTDDTAKRLAPLMSRIRYVFQSNAGVAAARNHGLRIATGEWIAFLDADDAWHPQKLATQLSALASNPTLGMLGTRTFDWPTPRLSTIDANVPPVLERISRQHLMVRNRMTTSSVLVRRDVVRQVGDFDTTLQGPEDHDYWLRVSEVTAVANVGLPLTGYRCVPGSLSKRAAAMEAGMRRILEKLDDRDAWQGSGSLRRRAYSHFNYSCAYMYGAAGEQRRAVGKVLRSLMWYPLPFHRQEAGAWLGRPRRFAVLALRMLRLMPPEPIQGSH